MTDQYDGWVAEFPSTSQSQGTYIGILAYKEASGNEYFRTVSKTMSYSDLDYPVNRKGAMLQPAQPTARDNYAKVHSGAHKIISGTTDYCFKITNPTNTSDEIFKITYNGEIEGYQIDHITNILNRFTFV